jgi:hypothetical protein
LPAKFLTVPRLQPYLFPALASPPGLATKKEAVCFETIIHYAIAKQTGCVNLGSLFPLQRSQIVIVEVNLAEPAEVPSLQIHLRRPVCQNQFKIEKAGRPSPRIEINVGLVAVGQSIPAQYVPAPIRRPMIGNVEPNDFLTRIVDSLEIPPVRSLGNCIPQSEDQDEASQHKFSFESHNHSSPAF